MKTFSEDGFALVFVIMITGILLLLGFSAAILTQDDYKMKKLNSTSKKNFYIAEALVEECDMKLYEYIEEAVRYSYENLSKHDDSRFIHQSSLDKKINDQFKELYKEQLRNVENKLEDSDSYNLKKVDGYDISVEVFVIDKILKDEGFNLEILSSYKDDKILERIKVKYDIKLPEYMNYKHNKDLISKTQWLNYKW